MMIALDGVGSVDKPVDIFGILKIVVLVGSVSSRNMMNRRVCVFAKHLCVDACSIVLFVGLVYYVHRARFKNCMRLVTSARAY